MKARDVIGRRIVAVHQEPVRANAGRMHSITSIDLDDGTSILFSAWETEHLPVVEAKHYRRPQKAKE